MSKPNALALGCRHRLIVLDHKSEKYLAFPLKCGILLIALLVEIFTLAAKQGLYQHRVKTGAMLKEVHNAHLQIQVRLIFIKILQISMFISVFLVFVHENAR